MKNTIRRVFNLDDEKERLRFQEVYEAVLNEEMVEFGKQYFRVTEVSISSSFFGSEAEIELKLCTQSAVEEYNV